MFSFLVCEFGKLTISNLVKESFGSEFPEILSKQQVDYIYRYLKDLGAKSVVLEAEYIDRDYLDDFAKFYVKRFNGRGHKCARLHFFSMDLSHDAIEEILVCSNQEKRAEFESAYLGFMVVKPLPKTFVGRTCLKVYDSLRSGSLLLRDYKVCFFGLTLSVESVAFQEQDKVVSACAATAIWSALHSAFWFPPEYIPSCSRITTDAINFISDSNNNFPSAELTNKQILRALDISGQRYYQHLAEKMSWSEVKPYIESYIRSRIPLILGGEVYVLNDKGRVESERGIGLHALAIVGFRGDIQSDDIFVHDDRLGPFARARIGLSSNFFLDSHELRSGWVLVLQEKNDDGKWMDSKEIMAPKTMAAVCPRKVRLPLAPCLNTCAEIVSLYRNAISQISQEGERLSLTQAQEIGGSIDFRIHLMTVSEFKESVLSDNADASAGWKLQTNELVEIGVPCAQDSHRLGLLTKSMAKHQWCAEFFKDGEAAFLVLFDATEISQGDAVSAIYVKNPKSSIEIILAVKAVAEQCRERLRSKKESFIESFLRAVTPALAGLHKNLDELYGSPRAPKRLKPHEVRDGEIIENRSRKPYYEAVASMLNEEFPDLLLSPEKHKIWVIDLDGTLLVGDEEDGGLGHPTLTGFKPARIGGEIRCIDGSWLINAKSGRYSGNYANSDALLENAVRRFKAIFPSSKSSIRAELAEW